MDLGPIAALRAEDEFIEAQLELKSIARAQVELDNRSVQAKGRLERATKALMERTGPNIQRVVWLVEGGRTAVIATHGAGVEALSVQESK